MRILSKGSQWVRPFAKTTNPSLLADMFHLLIWTNRNHDLVVNATKITKIFLMFRRSIKLYAILFW